MQLNNRSIYLGLYTDIAEAKRVRSEADTIYFSYLSSIDDVCFN
jgi:hypothetical protein